MVTKNEMVAIFAALTTDFDVAEKRAAEDVHKAEQRARQHQDQYFIQRDNAPTISRPRAG